jgi:hypothetical protein
VVLVLSLVGLHPFAYTSLATSFDGLLHLYRLVELEHLLSQGVLFPRWAPDFIFGFGYPIFNFYAPLAYYLTVPLHWLGISFADSATLFFIACTLAAGLAMALLAHSLYANTHASLVAAVAYIYAPTHIYDNFYRSAWGAVLAYAIIPFCLWALCQWRRAPRTRYLAWLALGIAALLLAHNVSALLALPLISLVAFALMLKQEARSKSEFLSSSFFPLCAITLGLALSAFFWVPAFVETQYIQTWRLTIPPDFDFRNHFLSIADWFAWPAPAAVGRINPDLVNTAGTAQLAIALCSILVGGGMNIKRRKNKAQRVAWPGSVLLLSSFFALILSIALYMTLPQSAWLWERISLLPSLQFPHRFLTIVALCCAVLSAAFIVMVPERWRMATSVSICALLVIQAVPFLYPRPLPAVNPNPTVADALWHERKTGAPGTTASGEYFPIWVKATPRSSPFEEVIINGENPQRFDSRSLPAGGKVLQADAEPLAFRLTVTSPAPFRATFRHFYFPGWQGYVNGARAPTKPSDPQGFSTFDVPAGENHIALIFESTPIRNLGATISLMALVVSIGYSILQLRDWRLEIENWRRRFAVCNSQFAIRNPQSTIANYQLLITHPSLPYLMLGAALFLLKLVFLDHHDTPLRVAFDGVSIHGLQYPRSIDLSGQVIWHGYTLHQRAQDFDLTLYWQAPQPLETIYSSFAHLIDEHANLYAQKDNLHPGAAPTTTWRPREYNVDRHVIEVPAGTPPGEYWIEVGLYDPHTGARLLRVNPPFSEPPDRMLIGPLTLTVPSSLPTIADLQIKQPLEKSWHHGVTLLGLSAEQTRLPADDFLRVALFWRADVSALIPLTMTLRLADVQGKTAALQQSQPSNNRYPTTRWQRGELVRDNRALWIPKTLPNGAYHLQLQLDSAETWFELGVFSR